MGATPDERDRHASVLPAKQKDDGGVRSSRALLCASGGGISGPFGRPTPTARSFGQSRQELHGRVSRNQSSRE
jgi:hypothetical protein